MSDQDIAYYRQRLAAEHRAAEAAAHPSAARSHARLAEVYAGMLRAAGSTQPLH